MVDSRRMPGERRRIASMRALLHDECLSELELRGDERILEVGCDVGQLSRSLAAAVPTGSVVATEECPYRFEIARVESSGREESDRLEVRRAESGLPLTHEEWGSFDVVVARHALQDAHDPEEFLIECVRALRPGGRIVVVDDDYAGLQLAPAVDGFEDLWAGFVDGMCELGRDPFVGRRVPAMLNAAGARPLRSQAVFCGGIAGDARFEATTGILFDALMRGAGWLVTQGKCDEQTATRVLDGFDAWRRRIDAAVWWSVCLVEGRRRVGAFFSMTP